MSRQYDDEMEKAPVGGDLQASITRNIGDDAVEAAKAAVSHEQNMTTRDAFRRYPTAVIFSVIYSTAIVMEGYDLVMINSFYGQPQFCEFFGKYDPVLKKWYIPSNWQTALGNAVQVGSIIGLQLNGLLSDRFGYRKTMMGALCAMMSFIFITFFAKNIVMLLIGETLCGIPWGVFQTLTVAFASEICPVALRPYLTTYVNLCWVLGQFVASGVLRGFLNVKGHMAFKGPFAMQWIWPPPILVAVILSPESPWWYVRKGRIEDAKRSLRKFTGKAESEQDIERTVAMIMHTNELEKQFKEGTRYIDCFRGVDLRRTEISCIVWLVQAWCGAALMGFSTVFYQQAGLSETMSFNMSFIQYGLGAIGTMSSWIIMQHIGRRDLYLWGLVALEIILLIVGGLGFANPGPNNKPVAWAAGSLLLIYTFIYDFTVGPVCYCLVAEMSSTRLRAKTVVLARNLYNIGGIVNGFIVPKMLSAQAWNWGAKSGLFWAGVNGCLIAWCFFRLPEPKGRTYGELDILFEHKVPARKFKTTAGDQFVGAGLTADKRDTEYLEQVHIH